jgi:uncharacterized protein
VGLIAIWNKTDQWHAAATAAMASVNISGIRLISTPHILVECANAMSRSGLRPQVFALRQRLIRHGKLISPTDAEIDTAWAAYLRDGIGGPGVADQIFFAVMRRLGISEVLTNDRHFKIAGFHTLF